LVALGTLFLAKNPHAEAAVPIRVKPGGHMRRAATKNATTKTRRHENPRFLLRGFVASWLPLFLFVGFALCSLGLHAQGDGGYRLVPNWPKLPAGMYFGLKDAPPPPAEREAQAAALRARGGGAAGGGSTQTPAGPT